MVIVEPGNVNAKGGKAPFGHYKTAKTSKPTGYWDSFKFGLEVLQIGLKGYSLTYGISLRCVPEVRGFMEKYNWQKQKIQNQPRQTFIPKGKNCEHRSHQQGDQHTMAFNKNESGRERKPDSCGVRTTELARSSQPFAHYKSRRGVRRFFPLSFALVKAGKAAAFATDDVLLYGFIAQDKSENQGRSDYQVIGEFLSYDPYGVMFRKGDAQLASVIHDTFVALAQDGEIERQYKRWFLRKLPSGTSIDLPMSPQLESIVQTLGGKTE